jgi:hypothetical protein
VSFIIINQSGSSVKNSIIMTICFERIVGPKRDVHELEFISALLQTDLRTIRLDGSITAHDIVQYLKSRHGVETSVATVRQFIVCDLCASTENDKHLFHQQQLSNHSRKQSQNPEKGSDGGGRDGGDVSEEIVLDMCQFASLMLAPELLEAAKINGGNGNENDNSNNQQELEAKLFGSGVLDDMLSQAHGGVDVNSYEINNNAALTWTPMALRHLFNRYNELDVSDELIHEMIQVANNEGHDGGQQASGGKSAGRTGGGTTTARECLIRALTSDLHKYNINWKNKLSINYYDALEGDAATREDEVAENEYNSQHDDDYNKSNTMMMMMMMMDPENAAVVTSQSIRRTATQDTSGTTVEEEQHDTGQHKKTKQWRHQEQQQQQQHPLMRSYTAPNIDFYADTHRRPFYVTAIWVCCVTLYFAYVWGANGAETVEVVNEEDGTNTTITVTWSTVQNCNERYSDLACPIINGITAFLAVFIQLTVLGVPFIFFGTLGASVYADQQHWLGTVARLLMGMITIIVMAILPFYRVRVLMFVLESLFA